MIEMNEAGPNISEADIEQLESNLGVELPDDYRAFMLDYNGGRPDDKHTAFPFRTGSGSTVHTFYSIEPHQDFEGIEYRTLREWHRDGYPMPRTLMPIGYDSFGNLLCLGVAGDERSKVYFRDKERLPENPPTKPWAMMKGYFKVADTFTEFLSLLRPVDQLESLDAMKR